MNKHSILFIMASLLWGGAVYADETKPEQKLVVHQRSGEKVYFDLESEPVTTFDGDLLVITSASGVIYYEVADVSKYTYEGIPNGIDEVRVDPGRIIVRQGNDLVTIDGLPDNALAEVYTNDGRLLESLKAKEGATTVLKLHSYPAGVYVINAGGACFKVLRK